MSALLDARGIVRRFGGVVALDGLDLQVAPNEIVGLIGPNGSGKTTFFNVVTGIYPADAGRIEFAGNDITDAPPPAIYRAGIARTFQRSRMFMPLSVFDNIMVGNHKRLDHSLAFNLLRREANALGIVHGFEHIADQLLYVRRYTLNPRALFPQHRVTVFNHL